jgi:uncharacterized protein (DUF58 family)
MRFLQLGKDNWARTRPTKEGLTFLVLSLFVGFAALNTGNNLLYLTFGMMLSFVAASGIISMINISGIDVEFDPPEDVFALTPAPLRFYVKNLKSLVPSYSLTIDIEGKKAFLSHLPPKAVRTTGVEFLFKRRGWNKIPEAVIFTRFPFGFFKKWIRVDLGHEELLVYPKVEKLNIENALFRERPGDMEADRRGFGDDLRSLRIYNDGDNPKLIHWKTSAKTGKLMLRELQENESKRVLIHFQPSKSKSELENQISHTASTVLGLLERNYEVDFIAPDKRFTLSEVDRLPRPVLRYLALF